MAFSFEPFLAISAGHFMAVSAGPAQEIGLYTPIQISSWSNCISFRNETKELIISKDVKQLYELLKISSPINLPCVDCKKEYPFVQTNEVDEGVTPQPAKEAINNKTYSIHSTTDKYSLFSDVMMFGLKADDESSQNAIASTCANEIIKKIPFFIIELSCTFNKNHKVRCAFAIEKPEISIETMQAYKKYLHDTIEKGSTFARDSLTEEEKKHIDYYHWASHTLYLKKVGQTPSLADMQFFDLRKYQRVLKGSYKELTRAIGLFSAGVGIGSFVYLRRIFEGLCEEAHQQCANIESWDEALYKASHFNERIEIMEKHGIQLLPPELAPVRNKLYGVLGKGIHEYTESECLELFPWVRMAIELILNNRLAAIERESKIQEMIKQISNAT